MILNVKGASQSRNITNILIFSESQNLAWIMIVVYGCPRYSLKTLLGKSINTIPYSFVGPWLVMGDFMSIISQKEKKGGKHSICLSMDV